MEHKLIKQVIHLDHYLFRWKPVIEGIKVETVTRTGYGFQIRWGWWLISLWK